MIDPSSAAKAILNGRGISRVVVVDDDVAQPPWYGRVDMLDEEDKAEIGQETRVDLLNPGWRDRLDLADRETRRRVATKVNSVAEDLDIPLPKKVEDPALVALRGLLRSHHPQQLTPNQWSQRSEELIAQAESEPTLFLIDQRLGEGREGGQLARDLLATAPEGSFCCLLTGDVVLESEFDYWQKACSRYGFQPGQVGLIAKAHLTGDQIGFARMLKISLTAGDVNDIRDGILAAVKNGLEEALMRFGELDLPTFTSIVFESSKLEGAWEIETILRIVKAFVRESLDKRVYGDHKVAQAAKEIAAAASVSTGADDRLEEYAFEIQHAERYVTADYLSERRMALANGDLFEAADTENGMSRWVLVAQPCDLAIRSDGKRNGSPTHLILLPVEACAQEPRWANVELQYFEKGSDRVFVRLTRPAYVPTIILDLAAASDSGKAVWIDGRQAESMQAAGWARRAGRVYEHFDGAIQDHDHQDGARSCRISEGRLPIAEHPDVRPSVVGSSIEYPIRRIGRLRERQAEAVLQAYGLALSRTAEAHDLARINP